jgi:uncharacterized protein
MGKPVIHFEVVGKDAGKLQRFYGDLFDWKIDTNNPMNYGMVDNGGEGINGGIGASPDGSGHVTFYVHVDDIDACQKKAESMGGKTVMPATQIGDEVTIGLVADPEGNVVGLTQ